MHAMASDIETTGNLLIEAHGITKHYDGFSLEDVDLTVAEGEVVGFIGQNGAGKSTTIRALLGLFPTDGGSSRVLGCESSKLSRSEGARVKEEIGVVFDAISFPEHLKVADIGRIYARAYSNWDAHRFARMTADLGLDAKKTVKSLSRGMGMKLSLACALSHNARLLILDEATAGLDPMARDEILDQLRDFVAEPGHAILMSSHITSDLEKVCDYITFINDGRIVFSMTKDEVDCTYGMLRCSAEEFENIDKSRVVHARKNAYSVDALVYREKIGPGHIIDKASLEDIMLYYVKEGKH